jgi:hypothetical protein
LDGCNFRVFGEFCSAKEFAMRGENRSWEARALAPPDYEDLRQTLLRAAGSMSREQLIDLADELFEQVRERRHPSRRLDIRAQPQ